MKNFFKKGARLIAYRRCAIKRAESARSGRYPSKTKRNDMTQEWRHAHLGGIQSGSLHACPAMAKPLLTHILSCHIYARWSQLGSQLGPILTLLNVLRGRTGQGNTRERVNSVP
ncbi:hypothetical protein [Microviridae Bog1249_12]|uniref:hypothetical protein n=1 Tax=Microviridae Bog1249_12 TaxID=1655647 RepID=UPI00063D5B0F|nr:hypothetical protein [Microviridae Bog1249_12]AKI26873.1 hypothetical protein [Microviridae Bog1249_12]AKI26916.1 hypothetical protein [Microviridae Fen51_42]